MMPTLIERLNDDLKSAMLQKDARKTSALRMLKSAVMNLEIQKMGVPTDADVQNLIQKQIKQREESVEMYVKGNRKDLVDSEKAEITVLASYLPSQITDVELDGLIKKILSENTCSTKKDFGRAMKLAQGILQGQADNKRISAFLNKILI